MLMIKISDLKERIQFIKKIRSEDGQGGWVEALKEGDEVWAQVSPIVGRDGFHPDDLGGGMASGQGYLKRAQPARYRVTVRREIAIPQAAEVIWKIGMIKKRFLMSSQPYLIMDKRFQCFLMVERGEDE